MKTRSIKIKKFVFILIILIIFLVVGIIGQVHIYYAEFVNQINMFGFYKSDITTLDLFSYKLISAGFIVFGLVSSVIWIFYYLMNTLEDKKNE